MTRRTRSALIGGVVVTALLLMGAGFPTKKVTADQWANGVCTTVNSWVGATESGAQQLNAELSGTKPNLKDVRRALTKYLGDTADATTVALDGLEEAGTPTTPKGKKAAAALTDSFKLIRKSLRDLQDQAGDVSVKKKAKALKQVNALNQQVNTEFQSFNAALLKLRKLDPSKELQQAFQSDQACQALSG
jgi:hypothetical protein